ncbi:putative uncharacterized protein DDB_G0268364 [Entelurus aequoreus]|uniref:putative uncharacterized protein DDB_G0268364 n=1 Tax=Entelurus aequoreus TaxID=161455 RepID=UPI002B1E3F44|nr:putative uncharacterized protein DDB_G0268364 [Entelurus aequoreus]
MRHRCAGAVHQHQHQHQHQQHQTPQQTAASGEPDAPVFSLPPPPSSQHRECDAHRRSLQELPCLSQPARRGETPFPPGAQQDPWAPAGSQPLFPSCHCSFSTDHSQNQRPLPAPQPSPAPIPPPPTAFPGDCQRLARSADNYRQASIVERCRGGGGDHRQLQQKQHCHPPRDSSPEGIRANSQKRCILAEPRTQQQQIPQLRAQRQLLVGSSLPVNYCASGSGELCRTRQAPLLQQQRAPGLVVSQRPQQQQQQQQHGDQQDRKKCARTPAPGATPPAKSSATGSSSGSSKESPNYGSSYHLWPESPHKGEERIRIDPHKVESRGVYGFFFSLSHPR